MHCKIFDHLCAIRVSSLLVSQVLDYHLSFQCYTPTAMMAVGVPLDQLIVTIPTPTNMINVSITHSKKVELSLWPLVFFSPTWQSLFAIADKATRTRPPVRKVTEHVSNAPLFLSYESTRHAFWKEKKNIFLNILIYCRNLCELSGFGWLFWLNQVGFGVLFSQCPVQDLYSDWVQRVRVQV